MVEVISRTPDGNKAGNSAPVPTLKPKYELQPRRVTPVDLDGPVGGFLSEALCFIAPNAFSASNWRGKLSTFIASNTSSFLCCGRAVGLAYIEQDAMSGFREAKGLFILAAEGATEQDTFEILKEQKRWARDLDIGFRLPLKEYSSLSLSKMKDFFKAEIRSELFIPPLPKK